MTAERRIALPYTAHFLLEAIKLAAFVSVCGSLMRFRFQNKTTGLIAAGVLAGILALQAGLLTAGLDETLVLTLLPVTAYIPAIIAVHVLSASNFLQTVSVWSAGVLVSFTLLFLQRLINIWLPHKTVVPVLAAALALLWLVFRYLRRPYRAYVLENRSGWLLLSFPVVMLFLLFSYWSNTVTDPLLLLLILLTALSLLGVMAWGLTSAASLRRTAAAGQTARLQLENQRREYEELREKLEQGRRYRHDMRHHLQVLEGLFSQAKSREGLEYISALNGQLSELAPEVCCANVTVNALLRACLGRARACGCKVEVKADIPQRCPVDELDLCVILANGIENAIHACQKNETADDKWIRISVATHENGVITLKIENPCREDIAFGPDGLPKVRESEEHGIGLKSVKTVVEHYEGVLVCEQDDGVFILKAALSHPEPGGQPNKGSSVGAAAVRTLMTVLLCVVCLNCMPDLAQALEAAPVIGPVIRIADLRTYGLHWGDTSISGELPVLENTGSAGDPDSSADTEPAVNGAEEMNERTEAYIAQVQETFLWYAAREYQGYVASDTGYQVLRDDEEILSLCFYTTLNAGGSVDYSRYFTLDKGTGEVLSLSDLFLEGSDYVGAISADILRQMEEQVEAGEGDYFIPGGIWPEEDCFQAIDADQSFYLDESGSLVIVFEEYEVAPGSMGMPRFVIDEQAISNILAPQTAAGGTDSAASASEEHSRRPDL